MYVCINSMYVCMNVCMYVCLFVCMYVYIYKEHTHTHVCNTVDAKLDAFR